MKLVTRNRLTVQRGTTLIELSVVIAVILLLVSVLFVGVSGWKNAANQAVCVLNIATVQKAVRSYAAANTLNAGDPCSMDQLVAAGYFASAPTCPSGGTYTAGTTVPAVGIAYLTCSQAGHAPKSSANW
ncbi:MAG: prepilin-type N-terminal cleavage/methylation domain-containing protein [Verrucomicrobia bacterium]|nr:prepilin-type N-terminal cleavage/methylation domain-containing protein [Verrucomicrobiota bacterium]